MDKTKNGVQQMDKTKVAIACQGGGSQTAFTAGVLKTIFDNNIHHQYKITGLTGTSGGALDAAMEILFYQTIMDHLRKISEGNLPFFEISPSNPWMQMMQSMISKFMPRERF